MPGQPPGKLKRLVEQVLLVATGWQRDRIAAAGGGEPRTGEFEEVPGTMDAGDRIEPASTTARPAGQAVLVVSACHEVEVRSAGGAPGRRSPAGARCGREPVQQFPAGAVGIAVPAAPLLEAFHRVRQHVDLLQQVPAAQREDVGLSRGGGAFPGGGLRSWWRSTAADHPGQQRAVIARPVRRPQSSVTACARWSVGDSAHRAAGEVTATPPRPARAASWRGQRRHHRGRYAARRPRSGPPAGRWKPITADGIDLFNLASVPVTRYRYRGNTIPNPWALHNQRPTAATVESPVR
ncbi:MAG: hypothetical protein GEU83_00070 [Pseudonocardiaceae bacterium]|nr:hypothetical protein [Pseudonocardiaceae bacterium]